MAKRRRSAVAAAATAALPLPDAEPSSPPTALPRTRRSAVPLPANVAHLEHRPTRRQSSRGGDSAPTNPNANPDIIDGLSALRASPDSGEEARVAPLLNPRVGKSRPTGDSLAAADGSPGDAHATTEVIVAPADGKSQNGRRGPEPRAKGGAGAAKGKDASLAEQSTSETAAAVPPAEPGKNKRKQGARQHAKADGPGSSDSTAAIAAAKGVNHSPSDGVKMERDMGVTIDPGPVEGPENENEDETEVREALSRPPPVNSDALPLPWKGRLGYACLNTYLRSANTPVFSSRTCRIASILEHRHPLKDPSQPEHPTKNRPDKDAPADVARGKRYVEEIGLANARDVPKMLRWNDKYGIKFMRLSSEMFPFASHDVYGYKLAPFAADTLREAGKVVAELGHRVTTHPGQFTQLGSPRKEVITASVRDLDYHDEMLSLLKLPPQQDRDAVMILHLGGAFGDKPATLDRFRHNYSKLSQSVKNRLVLENDDVVWNVHELLPLCQELNIPFVLDFHHHNIVFDADKIREGTKDIVELFPAIVETWTRKGITPKMHYSESCPDAITSRSRRKHSPRVKTLPPCPDTMDLMIEAKDKEQAVFELMRTFKLPGFHLFNDVIPHIRQDENRPVKAKPKKAAKKGKKKADDLEALDDDIEENEEQRVPLLVPEEEVGMGGPEGRVYWPPGMEEWLRPPKRVVKKKEEGVATPAKKKRKTVADEASVTGEGVKTSAKKPAPKKAASATKKAAAKAVPTPSPSEDEADSSPLSDLGGDDEEEAGLTKARRGAPAAPSRKRSGRVGRVSYKEEDVDMSV